MIMIIVLIVNLPLQNEVLDVIGWVLIWISLALTVISMVEYVYKNIEVLKN